MVVREQPRKPRREQPSDAVKGRSNLGQLEIASTRDGSLPIYAHFAGPECAFTTVEEPCRTRARVMTHMTLDRIFGSAAAGDLCQTE